MRWTPLLRRRVLDGSDDRMRAAQVDTLYRNVTVGVVAAAFSAALLAIGLVVLGSASPVRAGTWAGAVGGCAAGHVGLRWLRRRSGTADVDWRAWGLAFTAVALAEGLIWGWASVALAQSQRTDHQLIAMLTTYALAGGAVSAFGSHLPTLLCFFLPTTVPFAVANLTFAPGNVEHLTIAALATSYVICMAAVGKRANDEFKHGLRLRFEVEELAQALRLQKNRAEEASQAKSRFLAAASHDLRQPVHALSLIVGALRQMPMPSAAQAMVGHAEQSVEALDGLFSALLDISRLDAAVVPARPCAFPLQPMLDRVCRENAVDAVAKGLRLTAIGTSLAVHTDPVLLERVLRNLVANAVRYTDHGRVLVGCRRRGGAVLLEVWDTGRGIPPALHERVFEEFFQVGNTQRDRAAGLGLGLAIVRRLTGLLGIELTLDSREGSGTVFRVRLPQAAAPVRPAEPGVAHEAPLRRPTGGMILFVDDEQPIRTAMSALLTAWGYQVIAAASLRDMLAAVADCPYRPDLLICDYRLQDGEDGIATIQRLQAEYNDDLPAILVTGDTAPDRLAEARASGLALLHKPVAHAALRREIVRSLSLATLNAGGHDAAPQPGFG